MTGNTKDRQSGTEDDVELQLKDVDGETGLFDVEVQDKVDEQASKVAGRIEGSLNRVIYSDKSLLRHFGKLVDSCHECIDKTTLREMRAVNQRLPRHLQIDTLDREYAMSGKIADENVSSLVEVREALLKRFFDVLLVDMGHRNLEVAASQEGFVNCQGEVFTDDVEGGRVFQLQVYDPDRRLDREGPWKKIFAAMQSGMKEFRAAGDVFKCYVEVAENVFVVSMDPGKHKEFLACVLIPDGKVLVYYQHFNSSMDRANPQNSRLSYLDAIMRGIGLSDHRGRAILQNAEGSALNKVTTAMRLARSVKDLDLIPVDPLYAKWLFEKGVTNMDRFLSVTQANDYVVDDQWLDSASILNETELRLYDQFREFQKQKKVALVHVKAYVEQQQLGIKLNYEILSLLSKLQEMAYVLREKELGTDTLGLKFGRVYDRLVRKFQEMAAIIPNAINGIQLDRILESYGLAVAQMDVLAAGDQVKDAQRVYRDFDNMFKAERGIPKLAERGMSLQELVRYLHYQLHETVQFLILHQLESLRGWFNADSKGFVSVDVTDKQDMCEKPFWKIFENLMKKVQDKDIILSETLGRRITVWVADEAAGVSFPAGHHFVEMQVYSQGVKNYENSIQLRYADTQYSGADGRRNLIVGLLSDLGFDLNVSGKVVEAKFQSSSPEAWAVALEGSMRLMVGMKDLDMFPEAIPVCERLFEKGVTNLYQTFVSRSMILHGRLGLADIMEHTKADYLEKKVLVEVFVTKCAGARDVLKAMRGLPLKDREVLLQILSELEMDAKQAKDTKLRNRYRRIVDAVSREMETLDD